MIGTNNYLTVYVLSYIHLLLEGEVDPRILVSERANAITQYIRSVDTSESDDAFFIKQELTGLYMDLIEERQLNVEATLSLVLDQREIDRLTPIQRYYELEQTDEEFRKYWHSDFVMKLGKKADGYDVQHFAVLDNIDDMLRFELVQTLVHGEANSKRQKRRKTDLGGFADILEKNLQQVVIPMLKNCRKCVIIQKIRSFFWGGIMSIDFVGNPLNTDKCMVCEIASGAYVPPGASSSRRRIIWFTRIPM